MENNKKKALIKSVAAFTFAVSMFAAQSPTASAADVSAAGMLGHQITHGENEEADEAGEAVDATGDGDDDVNTDETAVTGEAAEAVGAEAEDVSVEAVETDSAVGEAADAEGSSEEETPAEETDAAVDSSVENTETGVAAGSSEANDSADAVSEEAVEETEDYAENVRSILGGASGYNVFVEGNYTQTGNNNIDVGDGGGVVAVGGNVDVGEGVDHKASSFEVGGSVVGTLNGDRVAVGEDCTVDFQNTFNELRQTSSAISQVGGTTVSNGSDSSYIKSEYGTITLKGSDADVNVFNMTVEEYNAMKTSENMALRYDVPDGSTVILNIVGEGDVNLVFDWGAYYNGGSLTSGNKTGNSKVMINVPGGNNVTIASGVGSLLAPSSSVSGGEGRGYNPHYEGQVICKEFSGNIQFGSSSFDYTIKDKPETPDTPDGLETPDQPDGPETPDTPDEPVTPPSTPDVPDEPTVPETPRFTDSPITPIIDFEMFDDAEVPLADSPIQEAEESIVETVNEDSDADSYETFDDAPVPLADNPLGDTDADSYSVNPKTGVDMTVPMGAAAAAMASFTALMIANRKKRDEN